MSIEKFETKGTRIGQSRRSSFIEAWINIFIGYTVNFFANAVIFPLFGFALTWQVNLELGVIYTVISLARSYGIRRLFNWIHLKGHLR